MGRPRQSKAQDSTGSFLSWLKKNNVQHPHCTIGWLPGTGRGVVAAKNMKAGDLVVEVPDDAVCMVENCCIQNELEEASLAKATAVDPMQEVQGLILAVMSERHRGKASRWKEYLEFIPADMSHMPMYWSEDELRELRGTAALDKMEGKVQFPSDAPTQVQVAWEDVAKPFIEKHKDLKVFPRDEAACWELYRWATAAVASYSFILGDEHYQAMVPFWDALNHITGKCNIRLAHHERRGKGGALQMFATRDIAAGEEVVNNYGELSQAELLRAYGYVETHPEAEAHAHVQVPLRFIVQAAQAEAAHMQHEHHHHQQHRQQQQQAGTRASGPSSEPALPEGNRGAGAEAVGASDREGGGDGEEEDSEGLSEFGLGCSEELEDGAGAEPCSRGSEGTGSAAAGGAAPGGTDGEDGSGEGCPGSRGGGGGGKAGADSCGRGSEKPPSEGGGGPGGGTKRKGSIRGLGLRLRVCAHYGLLGQHTQGVIKVYAPGASGSVGGVVPASGSSEGAGPSAATTVGQGAAAGEARAGSGSGDQASERSTPFSPPPELTEVIRLLLLPLPDVRKLHKRASAWKPGKPPHTFSLPCSSSTVNGEATHHKKSAGDEAHVDGTTCAAHQGTLTTSLPASGSTSGCHTVIDPGPVSAELAVRVRAVACRVATHMRGRYTCGLEEDERWMGVIREQDARQQQQQLQQQDEQAAEEQQQQGGDGRKRKGGKGGAQGSSKKQKGGEDAQQQQQHQQQQQQQQHEGQQQEHAPSLPPRFRAAVVARVGEKRSLAAFRAWWEGASSSETGRGSVQVQDDSMQQQQQQQQDKLQCVVADHVARVWSAPRVGMHGVKRPGAASESEEEDEDGEGGSGSSSEWESDEVAEGEVAGQDHAEGDARDQQQQQQQDRRRGLAVGSAAVGGEAQAAATLSRPNLAQKQHFTFGFSL